MLKASRSSSVNDFAGCSTCKRFASTMTRACSAPVSSVVVMLRIRDVNSASFNETMSQYSAGFKAAYDTRTERALGQRILKINYKQLLESISNVSYV